VTADACGFPFRAGKNARSNFDKTRRQLEHRQCRPGFPVARAKSSLVQRFGHAVVREVLNDHLRQMIENLDFRWIIFKVQAVAGDARAVGNFLAGGQSL